MFKGFRQNLTIEKAFGICEEQLGLYPRQILASLPARDQADMRNMLKAFLDQGFGEYDLAVIVVAPHLAVMDDTVKERLGQQVRAWRTMGRIQQVTLENFEEQALQSKEDWLDAAIPGRPRTKAGASASKAGAIGEHIAKLIAIQMTLASAQPTDRYSLGYIMGAVDALCQNNKLDMTESMAAAAVAFGEVFGHQAGPDYFENAVRLTSSNDSDAMRGMMDGGREVIGFLKDPSGAPPMGLVHHLQS